MAVRKESLTTIVEENESEISNQHETENKDNEIDSTAEAVHTSKDFISIDPQSLTIDTNASSYMCFKEVMMSSSSIFNNPLHFFPNLEDPGIEDAFMLEPQPIIGDECQTYKDMCKDLEIYPIGRVCKSLFTATLNLKYYVPVEKQMRAICKTLEDNTFIKELNLQDNWLSVESCSYLMNLLQWNGTLTVLKLKECRIGPEGMAVLSESLGASLIEDLDLSFNSLGDEGIKKGIHGLGDNQKMRKLNLSHNELTEECAIYLNEILTSAGSLEEIDLAWNCFNTPKGMKKLSDGFKNAESLRWINLAWNGISTEQTVLPLARYVWRDRILEFLDLSNNLLKENALRFVVRGISESRSLLHVKIGNNIFSPQQAFNSAQFLAKPRTRPLQLIDMENMVVERRFLDLLQRIREQGKDVIHGTVLTNYEIYGPYIPKVLFERCRFLGMKPKKKRRRVDFGQFVLSLPSRFITPIEFQTLIQAKKLKSLLNYDLVAAVQNQYMNQKTQKIDCTRLVNDYMMLYPDTVLAPQKKRKTRKKKGDKDKKPKQKDTSQPDLKETPSKKIDTNEATHNVENNTANTTELSKPAYSVKDQLEESTKKDHSTTKETEINTEENREDRLVKEENVVRSSISENAADVMRQSTKTGSNTVQIQELVRNDSTSLGNNSGIIQKKKGSLVQKRKKQTSFANIDKIAIIENEDETGTNIEQNPLTSSGVFIIDETGI